MNKKILSIALAALAVSTFIFSCDEVEPPYTETNNSNNAADDSSCVFDAAGPATYRKVLIEDYTGHLCGNCPLAAGIISNTLHPSYGDTLIAVGVHASPSQTFTETCPPALYPNGASAPAYSEDFRSVAGEAWLTFFSVGSNPKGMVSRIGYPASTHVKSPTAWAAATASIIGQPADVGIQIINNYDSVSGNLTVCIKTTYLAPFSGTYYLSVLLLEDSIKAWQENYALPNTAPLYYNDTAYVHRHVMRGAINSDFGVQLNTAPVAIGDTMRNSYSINLISLPASMNSTNPVVNAHRCSVVTFIYDNATKEILQAEEAKVE